MRLLLFTAVAVCVATALLSSGAAAQAGNGSTVELVDDLPDREECVDPQRVDRTLRVCDSSYDGETAFVTVESDRSQNLTLVDMGAWMTPGEPTEREVGVPEGFSRLRLDLTNYKGQAGVGIQSPRSYYPIVLEEPTVLIGGPWSARDSQLVALGVALAGGVILLIGGLLTVRGEFDRSRRVA